MEKEMKKYCVADVDLLRKGCLTFRRIFYAMNDVDPFAEAMTIAQACQKVFRKCFLEEESIAAVPYLGYDNHSLKALKWLAWLSHRDGIRIKHARNGGETTVAGYKVDGSCGNRVYEFQGCLWHGCPECHTDREKLVPGSTLTMEDTYQKTSWKIRDLRRSGMDVVEMWECEYDRMLYQDKKMKEFVDALDYKPPLNPRNAFGGRTNATCLMYDAKPEEQIKYIDVCSLYPWVNKYGRYPIGHPTIVTENFRPWQGYEGIIYCRVLPPRKLYHPVLPYRSNNKLLFPLCAKCADERRLDDCKHTADERAIEGTWVTFELKKAVEKGYVVLNVNEVWHFEKHTQYDPRTRRGGLFSGYIDTFLKMKQEADGWPSECHTEEDKKAYIDDYERREGVRLETIEKNEGKRCLAKLMLNSFWGKFGQRCNLPRKTIINDLRKFWELASDSTKEVKIARIDEDCMELICTDKEEYVDGGGNKNIFIAAYTTAQARLKLYSYLEQLDERVLYFDTDSIIYISRLGQYDPPIGNYLGDMTDELDKDYGTGSYITRFVSGGPKNYAYEVYSTKKGTTSRQCKVRGITLTARVSQRVNFDSMKNLVEQFDPARCEDNESILVEKKHDIVRKRLGEVYSKPTHKMYRIVYDKRVLRPDFSTVPYGY
ncbi:hypothetical protein HOLleu_42562 [Holothuria leucospilota]|uniref:DNA-directed DNA polymerase n=1 Tax=Holothuria leucospilota TaxID=206669 RepID=A0A9Q0YI26_HOLLE|nr:hypothetical protein HOLleu_42562 [Holothuria leucospilota]